MDYNVKKMGILFFSGVKYDLKMFMRGFTANTLTELQNNPKILQYDYNAMQSFTIISRLNYFYH